VLLVQWLSRQGSFPIFSIAPTPYRNHRGLLESPPILVRRSTAAKVVSIGHEGYGKVRISFPAYSTTITGAYYY